MTQEKKKSNRVLSTADLDTGEIHLVDVRQHLCNLVTVLQDSTCCLRQMVQ